MSVAFLFPGQGSQRPGMLHDLPDHPAARETISLSSEVLDRDVLELDSSEALASTVAAQLALLVAGTAAARVLADDGGRADFVAGHSVGAFAAAVAAGSLAFPDALRLVDLREAYLRGYGMGVVAGLDERAVSRLVAEVGTPEAPVHAANVNAPLQVCVSGADDALEEALALARERGARSARRLAAPAPSHTPLMASVAARLEAALARVSIDPPAVPYVSNVGGRALRGPEEIREDLARSVERPVRWHDDTTLLFELGVRLFVELPPGDVLTRLAADAFPGARCVAVDESGTSSALVLIGRSRECAR